MPIRDVRPSSCAPSQANNIEGHIYMYCNWQRFGCQSENFCSNCFKHSTIGWQNPEASGRYFRRVSSLWQFGWSEKRTEILLKMDRVYYNVVSFTWLKMPIWKNRWKTTSQLSIFEFVLEDSVVPPISSHRPCSRPTLLPVGLLTKFQICFLIKPRKFQINLGIFAGF